MHHLGDDADDVLPPTEVLRPDLLGEAFGTPVWVGSRSDGTPFVAPGGGPGTGDAGNREGEGRR